MVDGQQFKAWLVAVDRGNREISSSASTCRTGIRRSDRGEGVLFVEAKREQRQWRKRIPTLPFCRRAAKPSGIRSVTAGAHVPL